MSELIIIGYDDHLQAEKAHDRVLELQRDHIVKLAGLAVVRVDDDGKKHVDTPAKGLVGTGAASGALWGALMGRLGKAGIDDAFRDRVEGLLEPGKAAVVVLATKLTEDKFAASMGEFGGTVLKTSLSDEDEKALAEELA